MGWVTLTLRKTELKRTHADYQMRDLQISREKRARAREYAYEQTLANNDQNTTLRDARTIYNQDRDSLYQQMNQLRQDAQAAGQNANTYTNTNGDTLASLQQQLDDLKENYQAETNDTKTFWEDELAMIEEEANDTEVMLDQEQVEVESQMEAISQEMQAVSEAISSEIQNSTIKLS